MPRYKNRPSRRQAQCLAQPGRRSTCCSATRVSPAACHAVAAADLGVWRVELEPAWCRWFFWILFGRKQLGKALGVTADMVVASAAAADTAALVDRRAASADVPLMAWVLFAAVLQEEVWRRNA
jgi:tryptophan-rich sensory protein